MAELKKDPKAPQTEIRSTGLLDAESVVIHFGDVTLSTQKISDQAVQRNVEDSQSALERAATRLSKPGVVIRQKKGVPLFHVDEQNPDVMVRTLDGKTERGVMTNGQFHPIDE